MHFCVPSTARYQSDLEGEDAIKLAERFYCEAALINPDIGKSATERQKMSLKVKFTVKTVLVRYTTTWKISAIWLA